MTTGTVNNDAALRHRVHICIGIIIIIFMISLISLIILYQTSSSGTYAYIYQEGALIETINLTDVIQEYSFDIEGLNNTYNTIEVRHGEIGIIASSCPDALCMKMGFIHNNLLPVTCLPNQLVIKVDSEQSDTDSQVFDGITY